MHSHTLFVAANRDILPYLKEELQSLGFPTHSTEPTGVIMDGTLRDAMFLNLHLRTAHRILLLLKEFSAGNPEKLYREVHDFPWEEFIPEAGYISVYSNIDTPGITDGRYANLKCKDAIVDRIKNRRGTRPNSGPLKNRTVLYLFWKARQASIFLDTSGETLAKRSYRKIPLKAPMQENLAAAVIKATSWDARSAFINPMCGSGTLAIEAALIALNRAPGVLRRNFGFMHVKGYDPVIFGDMLKEAREQENRRIQCRIIASDIDPAAVDAARKNARAAGVDNFIDFYTCDFSDTPVHEGGGVVILNPEYGARMGDVSLLEPLYIRIGDYFKKRCVGYRGYVFSGNLDLLKKVGLKTSRRIMFHSGGMECRLHEYNIYEGTSL